MFPMHWTCLHGVVAGVVASWRFAMREGGAQPIKWVWGCEAETRNQKFTLRQEWSICPAVSCGVVQFAFSLTSSTICQSSPGDCLFLNFPCHSEM
jgi:hypothetical protein